MRTGRSNIPRASLKNRKNLNRPESNSIGADSWGENGRFDDAHFFDILPEFRYGTLGFDCQARQLFIAIVKRLIYSRQSDAINSGQLNRVWCPNAPFPSLRRPPIFRPRDVSGWFHIIFDGAFNWRWSSAMTPGGVRLPRWRHLPSRIGTGVVI